MLSLRAADALLDVLPALSTSLAGPTKLRRLVVVAGRNLIPPLLYYFSFAGGVGLRL